MRSLFHCEACSTRKGNIRLDGYFAAPDAKTARCAKCGREAVRTQQGMDTVHFAYADPDGFPGPDGRTWRSACNPAFESFGMVPHTPQPEAVTCPACAKTDICQDLLRRGRHDSPILIASALPRR